MNEISISSLISIAKKNLLVLISVTVVCAVAAFFASSYLLTPTYQSKVSFVATNGGVGTSVQTTDKIGSADISASLAMVNTYVDILKTTNMYKQLANELNNDYTYNQLKKMITIQSRSEDSLFIDVFVTSPKPSESVRIANTFLELGEEYVAASMNEPDKLLILQVEESSSAVKNYPNTTLNVLEAGFLGFAATFAIILVVFLLDKTIKGEKDFTQNYDIPVLGVIPYFKAAANGAKNYE